MKRSRLIAGALTLTLLAGCSFAKPDDLVYQCADIQRDETLITVGGQPITAEEYLFWLNNAISSRQYYYGDLTKDSDWEAANEDGLTVAEQIKADALEAAKLWRVMEIKAEEMNITLTDEQEEELASLLTKAEENLGSPEALQLRLDQMCISREGFLHINRVTFLNQNVQQNLLDSGALEVTEADRDAFIADRGIYAAKHILIATRHISEDRMSYEEYTDEERAQAEQLVQDLRQQLAESGDSEDLFDQLMTQYSEDGRNKNGDLYYPEGYTYVQPGEMVTEFEEGAMALEIGQISQPIKTDYGFHIILRTEPNRQQSMGQCNSDYKFNQLAQQWVDAVEVKTTKAYDKLDPKDFHERLQAILEAREAAVQASSTPAPSGSPAPSDTSLPSSDPEASPSSNS